MKKIYYLITLVSILFSFNANAYEANAANIQNENILVYKTISGSSAREACAKKNSDGDSNSVFRAVQKCISEGIQVVDKEPTLIKASEFCNLKSNQIKYGFTTDNKCRRKIVDVIKNNWLVF